MKPPHLEPGPIHRVRRRPLWTPTEAGIVLGLLFLAAFVALGGYEVLAAPPEVGRAVLPAPYCVRQLTLLYVVYVVDQFAVGFTVSGILFIAGMGAALVLALIQFPFYFALLASALRRRSLSPLAILILVHLGAWLLALLLGPHIPFTA